MDVISLFSGIGGFPLGFKRTEKFNVKTLCENYPSSVKSLAKNFLGVPIIPDVRMVDPDSVGYHDVLLAAFPCTDISIANGGNIHSKGGLYGKKSGLWFETLRIIDGIRPKYAVMENVPALRSRGLEEVLYGLSKIGYDATWTNIDAQYFGTPQRRSRIFILAVRDGIPAGADIFGHNLRSSEQCSRKIQRIQTLRRWSSAPGTSRREDFAYFTLQSFTEYKALGVASTLLRRDYKCPVDLLVYPDRVRRATPMERLRLNGYPDNWLNGLDLSDTEKYKLTGMNVPCVEYVANCILNFETIWL